MIRQAFYPISRIAAFALLAACGSPDDTGGAAAEAQSAGETALYRYNREYVFVSPRGDEPLVVPFTFRSNELGSELERGVRGWLARGATWDRFLDETGRTSQAGGVWRVVPLGDLRITAGGAAELESLRFERAERRLRLELDAPLTSWSQGGDTRFRLLSGTLAVGSETLSGPVLEMLRVERTLEDGWPPGEDFDALFLTSGDSVQVVLAETINGDGAAPEYAWVRTPGGERSWQEAEIRWLEMRPYQDARRDIPLGWSFRVPGAAVDGELVAAGFDVVLGPERAGRRAVEIHYTVEGWVDLGSDRHEVTGMIRHTQQ
ncbi:MAG: hypothetical protein WD737_00855 [Gemmatimonadota bacterium]